MRHYTFPKAKSKLPPLGKALAAVTVVDAITREAMDEKQATAYLRSEVGLNWSFLTAFQYLTGKEALGALLALPEDWVGEDGMTRARVEQIVWLANHYCANAHPSGEAMSGGLLIPALREAWRKHQAVAPNG